MSEDTNEQNKPAPEGEQPVGTRLIPSWEESAVRPSGSIFNPGQRPPH
jgi:hypothetical protein